MYLPKSFNMDSSKITIADYEPWHQSYFEKLNRYWIEKYFVMEPLDEYVLTQPEEAIIAPGGAVLMASYEGQVAGTVALRKMDDGSLEFTKMAVDENFRRKGIAEALSHACFAKAAVMGVEHIILFSNSTLQPAIRLYEKLGFKHLPIGQGEYKRSDVKMIFYLNEVHNKQFISTP